MNKIKYLLRLCCIALSLFVWVSNPTGGARVGREGELWLKMSVEVRETYATAYVRGFTGGFERGCDEGTKAVRPPLPGPENDPLHKCLQQGLQFSDTESLTRAVTSFYVRYPSDRYLYIRDVIDALGRGMTAEDIHKHASPGGVTRSK